MLRSSDSETEILLGTKQLVGIFFVAAILLGIAFAGGFIVGKAQGAKKIPGAQEIASSPDGSQEARSATAGETHSVPGEPANAAETNLPASDPAQDPSASATAEPPLGSRKDAWREQTAVNTVPKAPSTIRSDTFAPQAGQQFLQVAAVTKDEAEAVADVLHKKGFRAHAVPKPGNAKLYRVIVGPIRDAGELSATRDSLVRTGFREVIVQRY